MPAAGRRNNSSGAPEIVGSGGRYWSSTAYDTNNGGILNFDSGNVNPANGGNSGNGYAVRCVRQRTCPPLFFN